MEDGVLMCLQGKIVKNPHYWDKTKQEWKPHVELLKDKRLLYVPVKCGQCIECANAIRRDWQVRLHEEMRTAKETPLFVTLSFSEESLEKITEAVQTDEANEVATLAMERFRERWRRKYKKSIRHWMITELGDNFTERIHLHGIIWTNKSAKEIQERWGYGNIWIGDQCDARTVNYIVKYCCKKSKVHDDYKPVILTSPGIGAGYMDRYNARMNVFKERKTDTTYRLENGQRVALPMYYRRKIYSERQRVKLWQQTLDREERYVMGQKIDISENEEEYYQALSYAQKISDAAGYKISKTWSKKKYAASRKALKKLNN